MPDEITYPFSNFNGITVEVCIWISNFISHFTGHVITYPCWEMIVWGDHIGCYDNDVSVYIHLFKMWSMQVNLSIMVKVAALLQPGVVTGQPDIIMTVRHHSVSRISMTLWNVLIKFSQKRHPILASDTGWPVLGSPVCGDPCFLVSSDPRMLPPGTGHPCNPSANWDCTTQEVGGTSMPAHRGWVMECMLHWPRSQWASLINTPEECGGIDCYVEHNVKI